MKYKFLPFPSQENCLLALNSKLRVSAPASSLSTVHRESLFYQLAHPALVIPLKIPRVAAKSMSTEKGFKITDWVSRNSTTGEFKRGQSAFRDWISKDPDATFPAEKGRYHLYVSYACPWGWRFATEDGEAPGDYVTPDPIHTGFTHLRQVYFDTDPEYKGRFTVPTLYDKKKQRIVNNESSEIIRMFYTEFDDLLPQKYRDVVLFPDDLKKDIEETNEWTYNDINNGVYRAGFATKQEAYETAVLQLFKSLDRVEEHLASSKGPYYWGENVTEGDIRLYTTIVRFDAVYVQHFKTNLRDIRSGYPAIHKWLRKLYWDVEAFGSTTQFEHIKKHYTKSHHQINPFSITPVGPVPDILGKDEEVAAVKAFSGK